MNIMILIENEYGITDPIEQDVPCEFTTEEWWVKRKL